MKTVDNMDHFIERIERMNRVMEISCPDKLTDLTGERLVQFKNVISQEIFEIDDVIKRTFNPPTATGQPLVEDDFVDLADWLADIIVYTTSEARRWGIPVVKVLHAVMDSQDSKLDENGKPHHDELGRFIKGPNYKPPEEVIRKILFPPQRPEEDDGVTYDEEENEWRDATSKTANERWAEEEASEQGDNDEQVAFLQDTVVGLVIPFPRSRTGFVKIVGYGQPLHHVIVKPWKYKLEEYSPLLPHPLMNPVTYEAGPELDELVDKTLKEQVDAAKTEAK